MQLFHNSNVFGSCIIRILYTGCAKIKKKFWRQKVNFLLGKNLVWSSAEQQLVRLEYSIYFFSFDRQMMV